MDKGVFFPKFLRCRVRHLFVQCFIHTADCLRPCSEVTSGCLEVFSCGELKNWGSRSFIAPALTVMTERCCPLSVATIWVTVCNETLVQQWGRATTVLFTNTSVWWNHRETEAASECNVDETPRRYDDPRRWQLSERYRLQICAVTGSGVNRKDLLSDVLTSARNIQKCKMKRSALQVVVAYLCLIRLKSLRERLWIMCSESFTLISVWCF